MRRSSLITLEATCACTGFLPALTRATIAPWVPAIDLAGYPRIMRGTVDMGAYEFQGTNAIVFYAWVQHHGIVIDGTTDYEDPDGDGMNNWQEWVCYTCPTNPLMYLHLVSAVPVGANVVVRWTEYRRREIPPGARH